MRDVQKEPGANCAAVTGVAGDTNIVNGKANCSGAVAEIVPGSTPVALPGDPSWMFAYPLVRLGLPTHRCGGCAEHRIV